MNNLRMKTFLFVLILLFSVPVAATAQSHGGGGGTGCGDVFGDLIHIKRDAATGQSIFAKRWIEYPMAIYDWGYCPIAVDASGAELGFAPLSCDIDPLDLERVVDVDYFGRLNGGRTKERNSRMHFDEAISNIKLAGLVREEAVGRLQLGYDCAPVDGGEVECASWSTVDSPMTSLALYTRLMKYGHIQTDPLEIDIWAHGDPAAGTQYHEALGAEDWAKFSGNLRHLLAKGGDPEECFGEGFANGFNAECAGPERLANEDLIRAGGAFLAGAADKHGKITPDLVQYMNRILKITRATETTVATLDTLPALILDCGAVAPPPPVGEELPVEPEYPGPCTIAPAEAGMPAPADERFVDYSATSYRRSEWRDKLLELIQQVDVGLWKVFDNVSLLEYLEYANGPEPADPVSAIPGFVSAASDGVRAVEFVHNYEIPVDLGWNDPPTLDEIGDVAILEDAGQQTVSLSGITAGPGDEQALTVTAISDNPALIPNPTVSYTSPDATGSLSFAPAADGNGVATITVTVNDGMSKNNTFASVFVVTVTAVNDAPSFVGGGDQETDEDAGAQTVAGWAVASAGPADESGQVLSFTVTNDNNGLFATQPAVAADGTLTYTSATDAIGSATVSVTLSDDGGTDNGGADTSATQTFAITVAFVNDAPTLDPIGDVALDEDAGAQEVNLSGIGAGPGESQPLAVTALSDNPALIPNPAVSYTSPEAVGSLSFTPVADGNGTATITVTVSDGQAANGTFTRTFRVTITPLNDAPTAIGLSRSSVLEQAPVGRTVGTFETTDIDGTVFTYSLAIGGRDNESFQLDGSELRTAEVFDAAVKTSYDILVRAIDEGGLWVDVPFTIEILPASYVLWSRSDTGKAALWKIDPTQASGSPSVIPVDSGSFLSSTTGVGAGWQATSYQQISTTEGSVLWTHSDTGKAALWKIDLSQASGSPSVIPIDSGSYLGSTTGVGAGWQATSYQYVSPTEGYVLWTHVDTGKAALWMIDPTQASGSPSVTPIDSASYLQPASGVGAGWKATSYQHVNTTEGYVLWTHSDSGKAALWMIDPSQASGSPSVIPLDSASYLQSTTGVGAGWQATSYQQISATEGYVLWTQRETGKAALWQIDPSLASGDPSVIPVGSGSYLNSATGVGTPWEATSFVLRDIAGGR